MRKSQTKLLPRPAIAQRFCSIDSYTYESVLEILESRLWNKKHEYLTELWKVDRDDIISCIKTTHGVLATDKLWFLFRGEHLRWEDIRQGNGI